MARKRIPKLPSNPFNKGGGGHASSSQGPSRKVSRQPAEPVGPTPLPGGTQSFQRPPPIPEPRAPGPTQAPIPVQKIQPKEKPEPTPEPTPGPVQPDPKTTLKEIEVELVVDIVEEATKESEPTEEFVESVPDIPEPKTGEESESEEAPVKQINRAPPSAAGSKRSLGLTSKRTESSGENTNDVSDDERVSKLLERSRKSSKGHGPETAESVSATIQTPGVGTDSAAVRRTAAPQNAFKKPPIRRPPPKQRRRRPQPQPAVRQKRLDRGRHVEYKYEVRGLMEKINVPEEHRSSLLGSIWAKGERQDVEAAKDFLREQHELGKIDESMFKSLLKVIKRYTVRR